MVGRHNTGSLRWRRELCRLAGPAHQRPTRRLADPRPQGYWVLGRFQHFFFHAIEGLQNSTLQAMVAELRLGYGVHEARRWFTLVLLGLQARDVSQSKQDDDITHLFGLSFERLRTHDALIAEDRIMRHCAASYIGDVARGSRVVFSIGWNGESILTIDIAPGDALRWRPFAMKLGDMSGRALGAIIQASILSPKSRRLPPWNAWCSRPVISSCGSLRVRKANALSPPARSILQIFRDLAVAESRVHSDLLRFRIAVRAHTLSSLHEEFPS